MHIVFKRQIFCGGQSDFRGDQSFYHRIICQVQEHDDVVGYAAFLKGTAEKVCDIVFDAHGGEHDSEFFIAVAPREACFTICAASWSWGRPFPEKIGSFCPRIRVVRPSMAEIPVWM